MERREYLKNTTVILGAGASFDSGVPMTSELSGRFLRRPPRSTVPKEVQDSITGTLEDYWKRVFGWRRNLPRPPFEDHFTSLDLSANTGHNLGRGYPPSVLRVVRRFSIHRSFELLKPEPRSENWGIQQLLAALLRVPGKNTVVSLNWDTVVEETLHQVRRGWDYGVRMNRTGPAYYDDDRPLELLKLHGSRNWFYCDTCRRIYFGEPESGDTVDRTGILLRPADFQLTKAPRGALDALRSWKKEGQVRCNNCRSELSARVATFSYSKAFGFFQFDAVWERALQALRSSGRWIFIGYSLPEADFEFRHLLKTAQLASRRPSSPSIEVVLGGNRVDEEAERYLRFFGKRVTEPHRKGLGPWAQEYLEEASL